uniref:Uncharacterized protein n=1 Tax=Rhodnius prolixus TaxID=13249 RepID=T1HG19_RHOPR
MAVTDQLKAIPVSEFEHCYEEWKKRLQRCVASEGSYFEDALLADLQNSISPGSRTGGYGSLRSRGGSGQQDYATVNPPKSALRNTPTSVTIIVIILVNLLIKISFSSYKLQTSLG